MTKRIGIYLRVSTKRQALVKEGSLKNQRQLVHDFIKLKRDQAALMGGGGGDGRDADEWKIVDEYLEEPRTAKESSRRPEYQRLLADLRSGRIDTIVILALSRFSRSMADFLSVIKLLDEKDASIISLRESLDTQSPQGRFAIKILISVNELEVEIDSERMVDSIQARSDRGLWIGGHLIGYDLDVAHPGHLLVNEREAKIVNWMMDTFLRLGSIPAVVQAAKVAGLRTKDYLSRRGIMHEGGRFSFSSVKRILTSRAYLGEAEINKRILDRKPRNRREREAKYRVVPAVWPAIVSVEKFEAVQKLLGANRKTRHNGVRQEGHVHLFADGILKCDRPTAPGSDALCGGEMRGVTGTGKKGGVYPYYLCRGCGTRIPARQVEDLVKWRLAHLLGDPKKMDEVVRRTNAKLNDQRPHLEELRAQLRKDIAETNGRADGVIHQFANGGSEDSRKFVQESLEKLMRGRAKAQKSLESLDRMVGELDQKMVHRDEILAKLKDFEKVFLAIPAYKRRELVRKLVGEVRLSQVKLAVGVSAEHWAALQGPFDDPETDEPAPRQVLGAGSFGFQTGGEGGTKIPLP